MKPTAERTGGPWTVAPGQSLTLATRVCLHHLLALFCHLTFSFVEIMYQVTYPLKFTFVWEHLLFVLHRFVRITFVPFSRSFIFCRCLHKFNVAHIVLGRIVWFAVW